MPTEEVQAELEEANWITGVVLNLIGQFCINLSTHLIQYSHLLTAKHRKAGIQSLRPSAIFSTAWCMFITGNVLSFVSFSYATQTVLSSLGSVQFIANTVCIYLLFRIKPTKLQIFGTVCIIAGIICIVVVANKTTIQYDSAQLIELFEETQYVAYLVSIICLSISLQIFYLHLIKYHPSSLLIPSCYALVSVMIGTQSVVLAKSSSLLLTESVDNISEFAQPVTYVFLSSWVICTIFWLYRMNAALRKFDGVFIIPVLQVLWMLFSILSGGILFKEFDGYQWQNYLGFVIGTLFIFYGVYKLSPSKPDRSADDKKQVASTDEPMTNNSNSNEVNPTQLVLNIEDQGDIDMEKVRESMKHLNDESYEAPSINSLRNSAPDPEISEYENRSELVEPPTNSRSLLTIHKIFATSQKLLEKVTGADGQTNLAAFAVSSLLMNSGEAASFDLHVSSARNSSYGIPTNQKKPQNNRDHEVAQSLPAVMPSDLKAAFDKIRLDNLKEEAPDKDDSS